jgi:hypothetical protein
MIAPLLAMAALTMASAGDSPEQGDPNRRTSKEAWRDEIGEMLRDARDTWLGTPGIWKGNYYRTVAILLEVQSLIESMGEEIVLSYLNPVRNLIDEVDSAVETSSDSGVRPWIKADCCAWMTILQAGIEKKTALPIVFLPGKAPTKNPEDIDPDSSMFRWVKMNANPPIERAMAFSGLHLPNTGPKPLVLAPKASNANMPGALWSAHRSGFNLAAVPTGFDHVGWNWMAIDKDTPATKFTNGPLGTYLLDLSRGMVP